ncbi:hypothetical protein ACOME3_006427 [Neoechinorhynchus agilis]
MRKICLGNGKNYTRNMFLMKNMKSNNKAINAREKNSVQSDCSLLSSSESLCFEPDESYHDISKHIGLIVTKISFYTLRILCRFIMENSEFGVSDVIKKFVDNLLGNVFDKNGRSIVI